MVCSDPELTSEVMMFCTVSWAEDQPIATPLPTQDTNNTQKRVQTSMPLAGFELTITVFQ